MKEGRIKQLSFKKENDSLNNLSLIPQLILDFQEEKIQQLHDKIKTFESDGLVFEQLGKKYNEKIQGMKNNFDKELSKIVEDYNNVVKNIENKEKEFEQVKEEKVFSTKINSLCKMISFQNAK